MRDDEKKKLVGNERLKLLAPFVNGAAIAICALGGLAQFFRQSQDLSG